MKNKLALILATISIIINIFLTLAYIDLNNKIVDHEIEYLRFVREQTRYDY